MSLHFVSHAWQVEDRPDGTLVRVTPDDFTADNVPTLVDELFDLAREEGRQVLFLDFAQVCSVPSLVAGKLFALDRRLRRAGGRLELCNLSGQLAELLQTQPA